MSVFWKAKVKKQRKPHQSRIVLLVQWVSFVRSPIGSGQVLEPIDLISKFLKSKSYPCVRLRASELPYQLDRIKNITRVLTFFFSPKNLQTVWIEILTQAISSVHKFTACKSRRGRMIASLSSRCCKFLRFELSAIKGVLCSRYCAQQFPLVPLELHSGTIILAGINRMIEEFEGKELRIHIRF